MTDPKNCPHTGQVKIEDYAHNAGKANQELFFLAKCSSCSTILSVMPKHSYDQKFQVVFRDLADIKQHLATIANKLSK